MSSIKKIEDVLGEEGIFVSTMSGYSMYPMLRNRRDTIVVKTYEGRLKKFDVPLYKQGSRYILHRIIEVRPESYVIRGDNCEQKEYGITDEHILGVLVGFYRDDKQIDMNGWKYKLYVQLQYRLYGLRWIMRRARNLAAKVFRWFKKERK
mgnify:CR=1 FL=1